jgi:DNA/RNA-binding domain of Phe-tRNA-synthetase-like protein
VSTFRYAPEILARYPSLVGGVILAEGMTNGPTPEGLRVAYAAEQQAALQRIGATPLSEIESLAGWRSAFRSFGVDPTQYRSAAEALLRRLTKKGDVPSINTLVDLGNLVSIRYALPVAIFDTRALQWPITVRFADGSERFTPLGESAVERPEPGEVVFADETGLVIARRWCWRQSDESAARAGTTRTVVTVGAQLSGGLAAVHAALDDLLDLLGTYAGGRFALAVLDAAHPELSHV